MKRIYLLLSFIGFILPYLFFLPFLITYGLNIPLFMDQMFANQIGGFFSADVVVTSLVLWVFIYDQTRRYQVRGWWWSILANLLVGVSLALPLFLYLRERSLGEESDPTSRLGFS